MYLADVTRKMSLQLTDWECGDGAASITKRRNTRPEQMLPSERRIPLQLEHDIGDEK